MNCDFCMMLLLLNIIIPEKYYPATRLWRPERWTGIRFELPESLIFPSTVAWTIAMGQHCKVAVKFTLSLNFYVVNTFQPNIEVMTMVIWQMMHYRITKLFFLAENHCSQISSLTKLQGSVDALHTASHSDSWM